MRTGKQMTVQKIPVAVEKMPEERRKDFEMAFDDVYCFDASLIKKARQLQSDGKMQEAKKAYQEVIIKYGNDFKATLEKEPKGYVSIITPTLVLEESAYEAGLKQGAGASELVAKISLASAMLQDLEGKDATGLISKAKKAYKELAGSLSSLARTCDPFEDIAQTSFECEASAADKIANVLGAVQELLAGKMDETEGKKEEQAVEGLASLFG